MRRSSETIGAIAAALAKAQAEITNPEKALIATIRAANPRDQDQTFRYAALSSGLDIVRKALGGHEIATVQTTAIDQEAGLIRLTTTLAHSSGEWLSSEWPVCPTSETAAPRRMGAALTYARRYALFTLVGIAGEDDLDAPDLNQKVEPVSNDGGAVDAHRAVTSSPVSLDNGRPAPKSSSNRRDIRPVPPTLDTEQSAALRERLFADLARLSSEDEAADWVHKNLPAKNTLTPFDADLVEASFRERLAAIEKDGSELEEQSRDPDARAGREGLESPLLSTGDALPSSADGSPDSTTAAPIVLPVRAAARPRRLAAKNIRLRDKEHCKFVATQPCVVCGRTPSEAHHLRFAQPRALGRKVSDEYTVPVCRLHHRELHDYGDEASWWAAVSIDPLPTALELWRQSRLPYSSEATWSEPLSDVATPPAANVDRMSLDDDARNRLE